MFIRLHPRSHLDLGPPWTVPTGRGDPCGPTAGWIDGVWGRELCRFEEPVPSIAAEAAAIFFCPPPAERAKLPGITGRGRGGERCAPARRGANRLEGQGQRPPPTSRVMLGRAVRGSEATRTLLG